MRSDSFISSASSIDRPLHDTFRTGLNLGSSGILSRSRYCTPGPISVQPRGAMVCHPFAPSAGAGAGSERVNYERPQALLASWLPSRRFEPVAPPTTAWRHIGRSTPLRRHCCAVPLATGVKIRPMVLLGFSPLTTHLPAWGRPWPRLGSSPLSPYTVITLLSIDCASYNAYCLM